MQPTTKIKLADLNAHLTCVLCGGYYIDATTIIECLHSFCKTCIVRYLENNKYCPICDVQVHKTRPLVNIRSDQTLQDIVYKLVPGLFKNEMKRRREFYAQHPEAVASGAVPSSSEERGEVLGGERLIFTPEDIISLSLEYCPPGVTFPPRLHYSKSETAPNHRRYLRCPGAITVAHLKKLLRAKYSLLPSHKIDVMYMHDHLCDEYTMMDLAYIYSWRRNGPLRLFYKIYEKPLKKLKTNNKESQDAPLSTVNKSHNTFQSNNSRLAEVNGVDSSSGDSTTDSDVCSRNHTTTSLKKKDKINVSHSYCIGGSVRKDLRLTRKQEALCTSLDSDKVNGIGFENHMSSTRGSSHMERKGS